MIEFVQSTCILLVAVLNGIAIYHIVKVIDSFSSRIDSIETRLDTHIRYDLELIKRFLDKYGKDESI